MVEENEGDNLAPIRNHDLQGHEEAEREFLNVFAAGRLHHAWLICGSRGIGKATLAYRIARYVLSLDAHRVDIPDQSPELSFEQGANGHVPANASLFLNPDNSIFRRVAAGSHADFLRVERSEDEKTGKHRKEIGVDEVRSISSFLSKTPAESGWRVVVIDSADEMSSNAANALLNILESPPKCSLIILVSHNKSRLLPTVRSRCRLLWLKPLDHFTVGSLIRLRSPETNEDELDLLVSLSGRSVGVAMKLLEDGGLEIYRRTNNLLSNLPNLEIEELDKLGDKVAQDTMGDAFQSLWFILSQLLTQIVKTKLITYTPSDREVTKWINVWEETNTLFHKAESVNLDRKQVILNAFFEVAATARGCTTSIT